MVKAWQGVGAEWSGGSMGKKGGMYIIISTIKVNFKECVESDSRPNSVPQSSV